MDEVKKVYYPKFNTTRHFYDACRTPNGGYGGLFSVTFHSTAAAVVFFDSLEVAKGPSLGSNFTLWLELHICRTAPILTRFSSPYTLLAHYGELDWVSRQDLLISSTLT